MISLDDYAIWMDGDTVTPPSSLGRVAYLAATREKDEAQTMPPVMLAGRDSEGALSTP